MLASEIVHRQAALHRAQSWAMEQLILALSDHKKAVGHRLRQLIDALNMKYVDAAEEMGTSRNHLGNWMRGRDYPLWYPLYKFCRVRGVNTDWVMLGDPSSLPAKVRDRLLELERERAAGQEQATRQVETASSSRS